MRKEQEDAETFSIDSLLLLELKLKLDHGHISPNLIKGRKVNVFYMCFQVYVYCLVYKIFKHIFHLLQIDY